MRFALHRHHVHCSVSTVACGLVTIAPPVPFCMPLYTFMYQNFCHCLDCFRHNLLRLDSFFLCNAIFSPKQDPRDSLIVQCFQVGQDASNDMLKVHRGSQTQPIPAGCFAQRGAAHKAECNLSRSARCSNIALTEPRNIVGALAGSHMHFPAALARCLAALEQATESGSRALRV
jgi:hypothetical protein